MSSAHGAGIVGRVASPEIRAVLIERLLATASDSRHPESTRASAAEAVRHLAPALTEEQAADAVSALLPLAGGEYELSRWDANMDHPLSAFRISLHEPGVLRAAALAAVAELFAEHRLGVEELGPVVESAVGASEIRVVAAAFVALARVQAVDSPVPLEAAMRHPEAKVRRAALAAYLHRERAVPPEPVLTALVNDPDTAVRRTLVLGLRDVPGAASVMSLLADDPDAYVRGLASRASGKVAADN
jgi:hypothetical protein